MGSREVLHSGEFTLEAAEHLHQALDLRDPALVYLASRRSGTACAPAHGSSID
jgi:hypothetical protein